MVGTGKGALNGILIKSAEALKLHILLNRSVDKTGTITEGKPEITDIVTSEGISEQHLLEIVLQLRNRPNILLLMRFLLERADEMNIKVREVANFNAISGRGIVATIEGKKYLAGNIALMEENQINVKVFEKIADDFVGW